MVQPSVQKGFINGGIGLKHLKPSVFGNGLAVRVGFDHHQRHPVLLQLGSDLLADPAVATENHVMFHALQSLLEAQFPQPPEISRFRQSQDALNHQLHHDHATDDDQNRDQTSLGGQRFNFSVANGADGDQHHPEAVPPVPSLGEAVAAGTS